MVLRFGVSSAFNYCLPEIRELPGDSVATTNVSNCTGNLDSNSSPTSVGLKGLTISDQSNEFVRYSSLGLGLEHQAIKFSAKVWADLPCSISVAPGQEIFVHAKTERNRVTNTMHQRLLGEGSFKKAKAVISLKTGNLFVRSTLKKLSDLRKMAKQEKQLLIEFEYYRAGFEHPNIAKAHYVTTCGNRVTGMIMDAYEDTLEGLLRRKPSSIKGRRQGIAMYGMASALAYMHNKGYYHRDVKIDNFFVSKELGQYRVFLGDPGISTNTPNHSGPQYPMGYMPFISPDLLNLGQHSGLFDKVVARYKDSDDSIVKANAFILGQSDVYALGHAFYAMRHNGNTVPWYDLSHEGLMKVNSRRGQEQYGYYEPKLAKSVDHLVWEMLDPCSLSRPTMQEVAERFKTALCA